MKQFVTTIIICLAIITNGKAQQLPLFSHYYANPFILNPANAGLKGFTNLNLHYRRQYVGITGAPETALISVEGAIPNQKMGLGIIISNDQTDILGRTNVLGTYAYHLQLKNDHKLSFGLSAGFIQNRIDFNNITAFDQNDDALLNQNESRTVFDGNFGIAYDWKDLSIGVAAHEILQNDFVFTRQSDFKELNFNELSHYNATAKYRLHLNDSLGLYLEPIIAIRSVQGIPLQFDGGLIFNYNDALWAGAMYRSGFGLSFQAGVQVQERVRIGYAFDLNTSAIAAYQDGTHEILMGYHFIPSNNAHNKEIDSKIDQLSLLLQEQYNKVDEIQSENESIKTQIEQKDNELAITKSEIEELRKVIEENNKKFGNFLEYEKRIIDGESNSKENSNNYNSKSDIDKSNEGDNSNHNGNTTSSKSYTSLFGNDEKSKKENITTKSKQDIVYADGTGEATNYDYNLIIAAYGDIKYAKLYQQTIKREFGFDSNLIKNSNGSLLLVSIASFNDKASALAKLDELKNFEFKGLINGTPWIYAK